MNKRLTTFLVIVFALILTFLHEVVELRSIEDHPMLWSMGSIILATLIGVWDGKRKAKLTE